ncbi:hypothetical protein GOB57_24105 [Sinorhizobium meliloti]|nr:hypothetical protein [Sinorhizobium meliloti]
MSDDFTDIASVVEWFMTDKNGVRKEPPTHDESDLTALITTMVSRPDPFDDTTPVTLSRAWDWTLENGLLYLGAKNGWIDRDGKMLGCHWVWHAKLLYWLNMTEDEAERLGWVKVTGDRYRSRYRMSPNQSRTLSRLGIERDREAERMLPEWRADDSRTIATENLGEDANDYGRKE